MTVDELCAFVGEYVVDNFGRQIVVHDWMRDEVFRPFLGWKSWGAGHLCRRCQRLHGEIWDSRAEAEVEPHGTCEGLRAHKIRVVVVKLKRQQGKTTTGACLSLAMLGKSRNWNATYLGTSEDQGGRVFDEKFLAPVRQNKRLAKHLAPLGNTLRNVKRRNVLTYIPASPQASVGGTTRTLLIDEARDLGPKPIMRILPTVIAADSSQCTACAWAGGLGEAEECPDCGAALEEIYGGALIMSNAGEEDGWFYELVELLDAEPDCAYHLFDSGETLNTRTSSEATDAIARVFGRMESTEVLVRQELNNQFTRQGDEFLPTTAVDAHTIPALVMLDESDMRCVGFFDASRTADLSSSVICGDPCSLESQPSAKAFERLDQLRIDVWDPALMAGGRVNYRLVREHLAELIPKFPRLLEYRIDVGMISDAQELVDWLRKQPWGRIVQAWQADRLLDKELWDSLERRMLGPVEWLRLLEHKRQRAEMRSLRLQRSGDRVKVVDATNRHSRGRMHRDVTYSVGGCSWIADRYRQRGTETKAETLARLNASAEASPRGGHGTLAGGMRGTQW